MERTRRAHAGRLRCPACGEAISARARFCDQCGRPLGTAAASADGGAGEVEDAGRAAPPTARGAAKVGARATAAGPAPALEPGDRRIVTALFADIVDYSRLVTELDPEEVAGRIDEAFRLMADEVERYGGVVEKFIGDAVFALFGARSAHDDDAVRAALCAMAMTSNLGRADEATGGASLVLRIGIATGEVVAQVRTVGDSSELSVTGQTVTTAMRLQELAQPGETLLDDATVRAARNRIDVDVLGERRVRGRNGPVRVHRLRGERLVRLVGDAGPGLLIGRTKDRARLRDLLVGVRRTGRGRVALVVGEAGIGKTRLVADLEEEALGIGLRWTWTENLSYATGDPYRWARLIAQRVADELGTDSGSNARRLLFGDDLEPATVRRYAGAVAAVAQEAAFSGWEEEAALAPADPARMRADLVEVAERFVRRLVELDGPRAIVVDDLHWMDTSSEPLLERVIRTAAELPVAVILTSRPAPLPGWAELEHVEVLELAGLDTRGTERLAAAVAGAELAPDAVARLQDRTAGNPLFVGETVRALLEDDALVSRGGLLHLRDGEVGNVPVNLRALLGARIDSLPAGSRWILQVASVVGMTFDPALVATLMGRSSVDAQLTSLAASAIVGPSEGGPEWRFSHPLIRDVAYASTLAARRRELHAKLADHLESLAAPIPIGVLARHRAAAGDADRAVPLLLEAGEAALAVGAEVEAIAYWRAAIGLLGEGQTADELRSRVARIEASPPAPGSPAGAGSPA